MSMNNTFYKFLVILLFLVNGRTFLFAVTTNPPSTSSGLTMDAASKMSLDEILSRMDSGAIMDVTGDSYLAAKFGGQITPPPSPISSVAQDLNSEWKDLLRRQKKQAALNQASQPNGGAFAGPVFDQKTSNPARIISPEELKSKKLQGFRDLILKENPQISAVDIEMLAQTQFKNYLKEEERSKTNLLYASVLGENYPNEARTAIQLLSQADLDKIKEVSARINQDRIDQYSGSQVEKPAFVPMRSLAGPSESSGIPVTILLEIAKLPPESIDRLVNPAVAENAAASQTMSDVKIFELEKSKRETEKAQRPAIQAKQQKQQAAEDLKRQLESQAEEAQRKTSLARQEQVRNANEHRQFLLEQQIEDLKQKEAVFKTNFGTSETQRKAFGKTTKAEEDAHKENKKLLKQLEQEVKASELISRMPAKPVDDIGLGGSTSPRKSLIGGPDRPRARTR